MLRQAYNDDDDDLTKSQRSTEVKCDKLSDGQNYKLP